MHWYSYALQAWKVIPIEGKAFMIVAYVVSGIIYWATTATNITDQAVVDSARVNAIGLMVVNTAILIFALSMVALGLERQEQKNENEKRTVIV